MIRVGIVGCGEVADRHISFVKQNSSAVVVALADRDPQRLKSVSEKYGIKRTYIDYEDLITHESPEVLHILTPPKSHREIAVNAIQRGINVYVEKPVGLQFTDVVEIYDLAERMGVLVCAGYNHLFDPCMLELDRYVKTGRLGRLVYVHSHYGMNINRPNLQRTDSSGNPHWSYALPGGLFHNYIDHPLYVLLHFLGEAAELQVLEASLGTLPQGITDELRVTLRGQNGMTGTLVLSFTARPQLHFVDAYGQKAFARANFDTMTFLHQGVTSLPKAVSKATFNLWEAGQLTKHTFLNSLALVRGKLRPYQGMKNLIFEFHRSISSHSRSPVPKELVFETARCKDEIWRRCKSLRLDDSPRPLRLSNLRRKETVLVTGATGFVGTHVVRKLVKEGFPVRAFVRRISRIRSLEEMGVEILFGDIRDEHALENALSQVHSVVHLAADTSGDPRTSQDVTVRGTENLIRAVRSAGVKKLIYMSSMSVYETVRAKKGAVYDEDAPLEPEPWKRGAYASTKKLAEDLVRAAMGAQGPQWIVLRPAMIFGPGADMFFPPIGVQIGARLVVLFGTGEEHLRLIHVDDVSEAIFLCLQKDVGGNRIYNLVHEDPISKKEYLLDFYTRHLGKRKLLPFPLFALRLATACQERLLFLAKRQPFLTLYRLESSQKSLSFKTDRIRDELGWRPSAPLGHQIESVFQQMTLPKET